MTKCYSTQQYWYIYLSWGQYDKAMKNYEEALAIAEKLGLDDGWPPLSTTLGMFYHSWGQYDKASSTTRRLCY
jgi:tetratricopeptide (TPR) repeat protein